jgi:hypothetical protein
MASGVSQGLVPAASREPKLKGTVLPGGCGWMLIRRDDVLEIEVRLTLETDDKQQIYMNWKGLRHGPKEVINRLYRGETADPTSYYFRTTPYFERSSEKYSWLNRICIDRHRFACGKRADSAYFSGIVTDAASVCFWPRLCEKVRARGTRRIVFSGVFSRR